MPETTRQQREAELRALQRIDPRAIINRYCEITGRYSGNQLPHQTSFTSMIAAIVEHECGSGGVSGDSADGGGDNGGTACRSQGDLPKSG